MDSSSCYIELLPNELLLYIFEHVPRGHLRPATLVCWRWNTLIGCSNLINKFTLFNDRPKERDTCVEEYESCLSHSVRHYRRLAIHIQDERTLTLAVLALRQFGQHMRELTFTVSDTESDRRMKELEVGLEKTVRKMWEQEEGYSLDRCLFPMAEYWKGEDLFTAFRQEKFSCKFAEQIIFAFLYRYCIRLEKLTCLYRRSPYSSPIKFLRYEDSQMEHLKELSIHGSGHLILAKSTSLRKLQLWHVPAGPSFFASFGHVFPMLTHLNILSEGEEFNDSCLCAVSLNCSQLQELVFSSMSITGYGFRHIHWLTQLKTLMFVLNTENPAENYTVFNGCEALPVERLEFSCCEIDLETIRRMLRINVNLKKLKICVRSFGGVYGDDYLPSQFLPEMQRI